MKLTPLDIRHKEFRRGMRGYADVEVDEFLDEIADEYERLFKENIDLQERLESLEEKVAGYKRIEETLKQTLLNAQATAEEQKQNATKEARLILQDAELKSRQLVNDAYTERQAVEQAMAKLKSAEQDFRFTFRATLEGYLRQLGDEPAPAREDTGAEFARHAQEIKDAIAREASAPRPPAETPAAQAAPLEVPREPAVTHAADDRSGVRPPFPIEPADSPETTASYPPARPPEEPAPRPAAGPPEAAAAAPEAAAGASAPREAPPAPVGRAARERILFGEGDDLLADVDGEVNENEFKW